MLLCYRLNTIKISYFGALDVLFLHTICHLREHYEYY